MRFALALAALVSCVAPPLPASSNPSTGTERPAVALVATAPPNVAALWHWRCCGDRYTGGLALSQDADRLQGIFLADQGMGTYVDGTIEGRTLVFTRRWLNAGRLFSQIYTSQLTEDGSRLVGSFVETHAPGPAIEFSAERRFQPDLHDFNPIDAATSTVQNNGRE